MGESKRKKLMQQEMAKKMAENPVTINKDAVAAAVRQIASTINDFPGADCILYAAIGADLMKRLGVAATAVAGSASWRVGPGDGDVISHASEHAVNAFGPGGSVQSAMFHCWIETEFSGADGQPEIVDLTTWQLTKKARELDAADGGRTRVDFKPDYLWTTKKDPALISLRDVGQSYDVGVYGYARKPEIERVVLSAEAREALAHLALPAMLLYQNILAGQPTQVYGIGDGKISEADESRSLNLKAFKP